MLVAACGSSDDSNDASHIAMDQGDQRGTTLASQARVELDAAPAPDATAQIAGIVTTLNAGEIAQATFVLGASSNSDIRELAAQIQADHQANDLRLHKLVNDLGLSPLESDASLSLQAEADATLAQLQADAAVDLDFDYARTQVKMHQAGAIIIDALRDYADDDEMNDFLDDTHSAIEEHRDHARDVLDNL